MKGALGQAALDAHVAFIARKGAPGPTLVQSASAGKQCAHLLQRRKPAIPAAQALQAWLYKVLWNDLRMGELR